VEALLVSLRDRDRRIYPRRWDAAPKRAPRRLHAASRERASRLSGRKTQHAAGLLARGRRNAATRRKRQKGWLRPQSGPNWSLFPCCGGTLQGMRLYAGPRQV
jgi:hypothetical protein